MSSALRKLGGSLVGFYSRLSPQPFSSSIPGTPRPRQSAHLSELRFSSCEHHLWSTVVSRSSFSLEEATKWNMFFGLWPRAGRRQSATNMVPTPWRPRATTLEPRECALGGRLGRASPRGCLICSPHWSRNLRSAHRLANERRVSGWSVPYKAGNIQGLFTALPALNTWNSRTCASAEEDRMFSRRREAVTAGKMSMRACPIARPSATAFQFFPSQTSMR